MSSYRAIGPRLIAVIALLTVLHGCAHQRFFAANTVGWLLDDLETKATAVIDNSQNAANNVVNNAAQNAIGTLAQAREIYKDALHLTKKELTTQQRMAFEGIESRIDQLFTNIESEHDRIDDTLDNIATYLSDTVFSSSAPRISRFLSSIAVHGSSIDSPLFIKFRGKNLNDKRNRLTVHLHTPFELEPVEISDSLLSFSLNVDRIKEFASNQNLTLIPIEVSLFEDGFLFFPNEKVYKYQVRVIPNKIASATIHYKQTIKVVVDRKEKAFGGPTGSFRSGRTSRRFRNVSMNTYPDEGYQIDRIVGFDWGGSDHCSGGSTRCTHGIVDGVAGAKCTIATERGRGGRVTCSYALSMTIEQYKEEERNISFQSDSMDIRYDEPAVWSVPDDHLFSHLELVLFDGRTVIFEREEADRFIRFSLDQATGTIVLSHNLDLSELN